MFDLLQAVYNAGDEGISASGVWRKTERIYTYYVLERYGRFLNKLGLVNREKTGREVKLFITERGKKFFEEFSKAINYIDFDLLN